MKNEVCPSCGSKDFGIARNMIGTRHCKCGHSWLPNGIEYNANGTITYINSPAISNSFVCLKNLIQYHFEKTDLKHTHRIEIDDVDEQIWIIKK